MSRPDVAAAAGVVVEAQLKTLAAAIVDEQYARVDPELAQRFGPQGRDKCQQDAEYHLTYLAQALMQAEPSLFVDYVAWAAVLLEGIGIGEADLRDNLDVIGAVLHAQLPAEEACEATAYIQQAASTIAATETPESFVDSQHPMGALADRYLELLLAGDRRNASEAILDAVQSGTSVRSIYLDVFQPCQYEVGRLWQTRRISVGQEHFCTAATQLIMSQLYPYVFASDRVGKSLVATCVTGDLHEIGVRMVADFFEMAGWDTYYLGANVPDASVLSAVDDRAADVIAISATITRHVAGVERLIRQIRASADPTTRVLVGGYPFRVAPELWHKVGADGFAANADEAIALADALTTKAAA